MTQRERRREARRKWQGLISEQGRSGQSVAAFCRERHLCPSHFFWWKKRLRAAEPGALRTRLRKFVEVKLTRTVPERAGMGAAMLARPEADPRPGGADNAVSHLVRGERPDIHLGGGDAVA